MPGTLSPDTGYYYDALDYTVSAMNLDDGAQVTVLPETAIGTRFEWCYGFLLSQGASFVSHGMPTKPINYATVSMVQEGPFPYSSWWVPGFVISFLPYYSPFEWDNPSGSLPPVLDFRLSNLSLPSGEAHHLWTGMAPWFNYYLLGAVHATSIGSAVHLSMQDCSLHGGWFNLGEPNGLVTWLTDYGWPVLPGSISWVNNLFDRVNMSLDPDTGSSYWGGYYHKATLPTGDVSLVASNNLFHGGWLLLGSVKATAGAWAFTNNMFDKVVFSQDAEQPLDHDFNAYWRCTQDELLPGQQSALAGAFEVDTPVAHNVKLAADPPYESGALGDFYLPNNVLGQPYAFGKGSCSPGEAGLYHYTTRADQFKEGEEQEPSGHKVNIGLHFIALDAAGLPKDSDAGGGDGIPDYVENWHGDGVWAQGTETDWMSDLSTVGSDGITYVEDKYSLLYDDVDLDGDGLVGRIEKALAPANPQPLVPNSPITLAAVAKGEEPEIIALKVPISLTSLESIGTLKLLVDGNDAEFQECGPEAGGLCLLRWNTTYHAAGSHFIQAQIKLNGQTSQTFPSDSVILTALGEPITYYSYNKFQFDGVYGDYAPGDAILYAKVADEAQSYRIELRDPSGNHISTVTVPSASGEIKQTWDVTYDDANHTPYTGSSVTATFSILPDGTWPSKQFLYLRPIDDIEGNFDVAYAWHNGYFANGTMRDCMQWGAVDPLIKPFNYYNWYNSTWNDFSSPGDRGNPGLLTDNDTDRIQLMQDLALEDTRNFYFQGHGSSDSIGDGVDDQHPGNVQIDTSLMHSYLNNTFYAHGAVLAHPYRFVFLDSCNSADTLDWAHAFGIGGRVTAAQLADRPWKAQAFVGWFNKPRSPDSDAEWQDYTTTLGVFFGCWMSGFTVDECIDKASAFSPRDPFPGTFLYFPLGQQFTLLQQLAGYKNNFRIRVYGYAGLTRTGYQPGHDNSRHYQ